VKSIGEFILEVVRIADLDSILETGWSICKQRMQPLKEGRHRWHLLLVQILELEHDRPELAVHGRERLKETVQEVHTEGSHAGPRLGRKPPQSGSFPSHFHNGLRISEVVYGEL